MAWLFRTPRSDIKPDFNGLQIQTSTSILPIPIVWGVQKIAGNVIFYNNFQTQAEHGGGGKGGKGGIFGNQSPVTGFTYTADLMLGLCEGPIIGIGQVWRDQSIYTLAQLGLTLFLGTNPQAVWGYLATAYPTEALAYQSTAYVAAANYSLGTAASIGNHNFEMFGRLANTGVNGIDADPAQVILDFLTNDQYGAGFDSLSVATGTLIGPSGGNSVQCYCAAVGIAFSPALTSQEQASSILARWLQLINCAAVWSGDLLKFIPYGDQTLPAGAHASTTAPAVVPTPPTLGIPSIIVCGVPQFVADNGVKYAFTGTPLAYIGASTPTVAGTYGINPAGTYLFAAGDIDKAVQIAFVFQTTSTFVPNLAPIASLADTDFVATPDQDPIQVSRLDPYSLPTIQRIQCVSRSNQYNGVPVEARDQSQIELLGPRVGTSVQASEICDEINIGPLVAQIILQRQLYVRKNYVFKLSWEFVYLEPMDVIQISDPVIPLTNELVRIISIEEDEQGILTVTCEEVTIGTSTPVLYSVNGQSGGYINRGVQALPVNTPIIYEPPSAYSNNQPIIMLGASGGSGGVNDPNWGGCNVWGSVDGTSYAQIAVISAPARQGQLTNFWPVGTGFDTSSTLSVNLAESAGVLATTSAAAAQSGVPLCLVDGELFAFETATLTAPFSYDITNIQRGLFGTNGSNHLNNTQFAVLDSAIETVTLPDAFVGQLIYLKFQSFNVFGGGLEPLSECTVYTYTPTGNSRVGPVTSALELGTSLDYGRIDADPVSEFDNWGNVSTAATIFIDLGDLTP